MATTGDLAGSLEALRLELSHIKYEYGLHSVRCQAGDPVELLPVLSFALLRFSRHVAHLAEGYQLLGKTDARFVEAAWRFLREKLDIKPALTPAQFLSEGFAERKLQLLRQVVKAAKAHHNAEARKARLAALKGAGHLEQRLYCRRAGSQSPAKARPPAAKVVCAAVAPDAATEQAECGGVEEPGGGTAELAGTGGQHGWGAEPAAFPEEEQPEAAEPAAAQSPALPDWQQLQPALYCVPSSPQLEQPRPLPAPLLQPSAGAAARIAGPQGWQDTGQAAAQLSAAPTGVPSSMWCMQPAAAAAALPPQSTEAHAVVLQQAERSPAAQQIVMVPAAGACSGGEGPADSATQRLIEELQLRLQLAEEMGLEARRSAERAQEELQARVAVLEGRVKFLESGFGLQPLQGPPTAQLQLPWRSTPPRTPPSSGQHWQQQQQQQHEQAAAGAIGAHWQAAAQRQQQPCWQPGLCGREAQLPPWLGTPSSLQPAPPPALLPPRRTPAAASHNRGTPATAAAWQAPAPALSPSSTTELISSLQSRFSEAEEFLKSLQRP